MNKIVAMKEMTRIQAEDAKEWGWQKGNSYISLWKLGVPAPQGDRSIFLNFGACLLNIDGCFCRHESSGTVVCPVSNFALRFV